VRHQIQGPQPIKPDSKASVTAGWQQKATESPAQVRLAGLFCGLCPVLEKHVKTGRA
jgi:hypothetical protein